jgi:hypothetical protein
MLVRKLQIYGVGPRKGKATLFITVQREALRFHPIHV